MLDDMRVLREAVEGYRAAATVAGLDWPDHAESPGAQPPDLVYRLFDVDHVAEQLTWLVSQGWQSRMLLPSGGQIEAWPTDADQALDSLSRSWGTPFPWRHQMPLFSFDRILYTFVLAGDHEGEIWRTEFEADDPGPVRAATSLAELFTAWTKGITAGVVVYDDSGKTLEIPYDGIHDFTDVLRERVPDADFPAFPVHTTVTSLPLLRQRQHDCGVDMICIGREFECEEELQADIDATLASLGL